MLKALSLFEFNLRDKAVTYEQLWVEDFSAKLDTSTWKLSSEDIKVKNEHLVMELMEGTSRQEAILRRNISADSGYVLIRASVPTAAQFKASAQLLKNTGRSLDIAASETFGDYTILKSSIIATKDLDGIAFALESLPNLDSLSLNSSGTNRFLLDRIEFHKLVRPKKLF